MQMACEGSHFHCSDRVRRSPNESEISETAWEWSHIHFSDRFGRSPKEGTADIPDVLPHETAVAWARTYFKKHPVAKGAGVADMERQFRAILEQCAQHINAEYDVGGLCKAFPTRLRELIAAEGERLSH